MLPVRPLQQQALGTETGAGRAAVGVVAAETRNETAMGRKQNECDYAHAKDIHFIVVSFSSIHLGSYGTIADKHKPV